MISSGLKDKDLSLIIWYQSIDLGMDERRMQLRTDWRDIIEVELKNFRIRMTKIIDEMFVKKDDVIVVKQEPEIKETSNGCEFERNECNPVLEEDETVADEAPIDIKIKRKQKLLQGKIKFKNLLKKLEVCRFGWGMTTQI